MNLLILAVFLSIVQASPPVPRQTADNPARKSQQQASHANSDKTPAAPVPVQTTPRPDPQQGDGGIKPSNEQQHAVAISELPPVSVSRDGWDWFYLALTALLVLIGGITVAAIWYQAKETRKAAEAARDSALAAQKSAEAMEKSVRLQEVAMRQWVDFEDFEVESAHFVGNATGTRLYIKFRITNPTKMLLTLTSISVDCGKERQDSTLRETLSPDNGYPVIAMMPIGGESFLLYKNHKLVFPVIVVVGFEDAFEVAREQTDACMCICGSPNFAEFSPYEGIISKREGEAEQNSQNPN